MERSRGELWKRLGSLLTMIFFASRIMGAPNETLPRRDINAVLRAHDREWLKLPYVVGVYVGELPDGKTACLTVMLSRPAPSTEEALPKTVEGYPVVTEVTGKIRPLR